MQFALLIYESPEAFASRKNDEIDTFTGAWRAYSHALFDAGVDQSMGSYMARIVR